MCLESVGGNVHLELGDGRRSSNGLYLIQIHLSLCITTTIITITNTSPLIGVEVVLELEVLDGEGDDGGVLLLVEIVLGEPTPVNR